MSELDRDLKRPSRWAGGVRWFAAELLIVVSGVLIALAIGSAYEHQQDRLKERRYLGQLAADLEQTESLMTAADSVNAGWDRSIAALVGAYRGHPTPSRDSVLRWVEGVLFDNPVPVMGTADALIETGDLQLIRDLALRSMITSYLSRTREYNVPWLLSLENEFMSARTAFRDRVDLLEVEQYTNSGLGSAARLNLGTTSPYPLNVTRLLDDRDAYFQLVRMIEAKTQLAEVRAAFRSDAASLRKRIDAASNGRS